MDLLTCAVKTLDSTQTFEASTSPLRLRPLLMSADANGRSAHEGKCGAKAELMKKVTDPMNTKTRQLLGSIVVALPATPSSNQREIGQLEEQRC